MVKGQGALDFRCSNNEEMEEEKKKNFTSIDQLIMQMVLQRRGGTAYCVFGDSHHCHYLNVSVGMASQAYYWWHNSAVLTPKDNKELLSSSSYQRKNVHG